MPMNTVWRESTTRSYSSRSWYRTALSSSATRKPSCISISSVAKPTPATAAARRSGSRTSWRQASGTRPGAPLVAAVAIGAGRSAARAGAHRRCGRGVLAAAPVSRPFEVDDHLDAQVGEAGRGGGVVELDLHL